MGLHGAVPPAEDPRLVRPHHQPRPPACVDSSRRLGYALALPLRAADRPGCVLLIMVRLGAESVRIHRRSSRPRRDDRDFSVPAVERGGNDDVSGAFGGSLLAEDEIFISRVDPPDKPNTPFPLLSSRKGVDSAGVITNYPLSHIAGLSVPSFFFFFWFLSAASAIAFRDGVRKGQGRMSDETRH